MMSSISVRRSVVVACVVAGVRDARSRLRRRPPLRHGYSRTTVSPSAASSIPDPATWLSGRNGTQWAIWIRSDASKRACRGWHAPLVDEHVHRSRPAVGSWRQRFEPDDQDRPAGEFDRRLDSRQRISRRRAGSLPSGGWWLDTSSGRSRTRQCPFPASNWPSATTAMPPWSGTDKTEQFQGSRPCSGPQAPRSLGRAPSSLPRAEAACALRRSRWTQPGTPSSSGSDVYDVGGGTSRWVMESNVKAATASSVARRAVQTRSRNRTPVVHSVAPMTSP